MKNWLVLMLLAAGGLASQPASPAPFPQVNTAILADKGGQVFNVKAYGATGNGVTDDRGAIMAAVSAARSAGGGIIYFPPGTYAVASTLLLTNMSGLNFQGVGMATEGPPASTGSTILWKGGNNGIMMLGGGLQYSSFRDLTLSAGSARGVTIYYGVGNPVYDVSTWVTFDHVKFLLPRTPQAGGIGAVLGSTSTTPARDQVDRQRFKDCDFRYGNTGIGVQLRSINGLNETFEGDSFTGLIGSTAYGIDFISGGFVSYNSIFLGNHAGIYAEDPPGWGASNIAVIGGHSESEDYSIETLGTNWPGGGGATFTVQDFFEYNASSKIAFNLLNGNYIYNLFNDYIYTNAKITVPQGIGRVVNAIGVIFFGSGLAGNFQTPDGNQVAPSFGQLDGSTYNSGHNVLNGYWGNLLSNVISLQMSKGGPQPAAKGFIRMKAGDAVNFKNQSNNADVNGLSENAANQIVVGGEEGIQVTTLATSANCASSASPAVCSAAPEGSVVIAPGATSVVVYTTRVTAHSRIQLTVDSSLGAELGVACNTQSLLVLGAPRVIARTPGASFTVGIDAPPATRPLCIAYGIIN